MSEEAKASIRARYSRVVVDGDQQAPSRAMLRAVGFTRRGFRQAADRRGLDLGATSRPATCTSASWRARPAAGVDAAGGKSVLFNTITVSDGISMGTPGHALLAGLARDHRRLDRERWSGAAGFDGFVAIGGCDKNMPGCAMAMARLNRPSVFVYGGTIRPGAQRRDIVSVFEAVGAHAAGKLSDAGLLEIERTAIPGPGSCGGMYTANTMASAIEALGLVLAGQLRAGGDRARTSAPTAAAPARRSCAWCATGLKPRDILTRRPSRTPSPW